MAVKLASQLNDRKLLASSFYRLGHSYSDAKQYALAIESYEKSQTAFHAAGLSRDEVYVLADLGALYFIQEDYTKAREDSERSLDILKTVGPNVAPGTYPDEFGKARALLTLGDLDTHEGNSEQAIEKLQQSLILYQQLRGVNPAYDLYLADVYGALGRAYPEIGQANIGLMNLNKALDIAIRLSNADVEASLRNDIGYLYLEQEDYDQAYLHFTQSLNIYSAAKNQAERARVLLNLGVVEQRKINYDEALRYFRLSLEIGVSTGSIDNQIAAQEGVGVVLTGKRDFVGALDALNKGLTLARNTGNTTRQTELLWRSAQVYFETRDYSQSTALADSALKLARASHLSKLTYLATTTLGESYAAQKKSDLAVETLTEAVRQLESLRENVAGSELETQLFLENKVASYDALVELLVNRGKSRDALLYAERGKGRVLLDALRGPTPDLVNALTAVEKAEWQRLNQTISEVNDRIRKHQTADSPSLDSLYTRLDNARLEFQSFQDSLYVKHPELKIRTGETSSVTSADLTALTASGSTAFLEYAVAKDHVFLFVLTKSMSNVSPDVRIYPISLRPDDLVRKVNEFHDAIANQRLAYATGAHELYSILIGPAEEQIKTADSICIVPDSFLWNVPFQALMTSNDRFTIEDRSVYYAPSLSVLNQMNRKERPSGNTQPSLVAFGNPVIGKDEQLNADLCPLPQAEQEVSEIAKSFDSKTTNVLIGRNATEKTFKNLAKNYSLIHLATHGVIDNRNPLYSHLLLTGTEGDPENDGRLEARQIMNMSLPADLAVLSACETANGRIAPGEGVMGLSWAFFVAGTRATLVSQWKINSDSTSELMSNFYKNLNANRSDVSGRNPRALKEASLSMIHSKRYSHPFYWAGFILVGS